jgi:polysaccharide export outer membrane protein
MKVLRLLVIIALVGSVAGTAMADVKAPEKVVTAAQRDYIIGPGDVLEVSVWKEEALTKSLSVLPDGKISFPLIGQVQAAGRTVALLTKDIETRLARFIPDPNLSVGVQQVNSLLIYVIGKVNNPGRFALNTNINVMQALSMAGGLNTFADRGDIRIFRTIGGRNLIYRFDYDDVSAGKDLRQNITLMRGDVVVAR